MKLMSRAKASTSLSHIFKFKDFFVSTASTSSTGVSDLIIVLIVVV